MPGVENWSDIFTKAVKPAEQFQKLRDVVMGATPVRKRVSKVKAFESVEGGAVGVATDTTTGTCGAEPGAMVAMTAESDTHTVCVVAVPPTRASGE